MKRCLRIRSGRSVRVRAASMAPPLSRTGLRRPDARRRRHSIPLRPTFGGQMFTSRISVVGRTRRVQADVRGRRGSGAALRLEARSATGAAGAGEEVDPVGGDPVFAAPARGRRASTRGSAGDRRRRRASPCAGARGRPRPGRRRSRRRCRAGGRGGRLPRRGASGSRGARRSPTGLGSLVSTPTRVSEFIGVSFRPRAAAGAI